jgi:transcriptional regulator with XRE-family HTH domain
MADTSNLQRPRLGDLLREVRMGRDLTQLQLAMRLSDHGYVIGEAAISRYETGGRKVPVDALFYYALALRLTKAEAYALLDARMIQFKEDQIEEFEHLLEDYRARRSRPATPLRTIRRGI